MRLPAHTLLSVTLVLAISAVDPGPVSAQTDTRQGIAAAAQAPAPTEAPPSVTGLIVRTLDDFRQIPSLTNLAILTAGGIGATIGHAMDRDVSNAMYKSEGLDELLHVGETVGGAREQLAAALATYTLGRVMNNSRLSNIGGDLIRAQIVTQSMTAAIKLSVGRTRPDGTMYSFPSGHSSVTFATATVLQRNLGWKVGIPAYGLATYVAASRIHDKRHFLSDVTFGAALGIVAGRAVTVGSGDAKFAVAPAATAGGAGVSFTWLGGAN